MRLHLDDDKYDSQMCLTLVVAVMILAGSAILYMGTRYQSAPQTPTRILLASPL